MIRVFSRLMAKIGEMFPPFRWDEKICRTCDYLDDAPFSEICLNPESDKWGEEVSGTDSCDQWEEYKDHR